MKKILMLGAASVFISAAANAAPVNMPDTDGSPSMMTYNASMPADQFEDAGSSLTAKFSFHGNVTKTCAIMGVDNGAVGLNGNVDLGTIGISAGDDQAVNTLFTMTGNGSVALKSGAAGCNYRNNLSLSKDSILGLVNSGAGSYDSNEFQANIPYAAEAKFTGVADGAGAVAGTAQSVSLAVGDVSANKNFGAWRSPLNIDVTIPQVTGKGLVGGTYTGTLTLTLAII